MADADIWTPAGISKMFGKILPKAIAELLGEIVGSVLGILLVKKAADGALKFELNPQGRNHAPRFFRTQSHSAKFALLISQLDPQEQRAITDHLVRRGYTEDHQADVHIRCAEMYEEALARNNGDANQAAQEVVKVLRDLAALANNSGEMDRFLNARNMCRPRGELYPAAKVIKRLEEAAGIAGGFASGNDLIQWSNRTIRSALLRQRRERRNSPFRALMNSPLIRAIIR